MTDLRLEELAKIYGIEINYVEKGKGGLFLEDSQGQKRVLDDIFDSNDYIVSGYESINLKKCNTYTSYVIMEDLLSNAA